jgi:trimethylamine--corrinoid protein Co-methyltransferase
MSRGIVVDDETLALDAIRHVGPGGSFLGERHTRQHMRALWQPALFDRRPYQAWEQQRDGARDWARARAQAILRDHHPEPLDARLSAELRRIIAEVERAVPA